MNTSLAKRAVTSALAAAALLTPAAMAQDEDEAALFADFPRPDRPYGWPSGITSQDAEALCLVQADVTPAGRADNVCAVCHALTLDGEPAGEAVNRAFAEQLITDSSQWRYPDPDNDVGGGDFVFVGDQDRERALVQSAHRAVIRAMGDTCYGETRPPNDSPDTEADT